MKNKLIKLITIIAISTLAINFFSFAPAAHATTDICDSSATQAVKDAAGCNGNGNALRGIITNIIYAVIATIGLVAVIYIVVGGVNYMTSAGDTGKIEKAKKTILYACIGLAVCALSFAIVNWVILGPLSSSSSTEDDSDTSTSQDVDETDANNTDNSEEED